MSDQLTAEKARQITKDNSFKQGQIFANGIKDIESRIEKEAKRGKDYIIYDTRWLNDFREKIVHHFEDLHFEVKWSNVDSIKIKWS